MYSCEARYGHIQFEAESKGQAQCCEICGKEAFDFRGLLDPTTFTTLSACLTCFLKDEEAA